MAYFVQVSPHSWLDVRQDGMAGEHHRGETDYSIRQAGGSK